MLALFALLISNASVTENRDWFEFDRRRMGWADSAFSYDAASIRRADGLVYVWITYKYYLSGLPDPVFLERLAIDCAGRRIRVVEWVRTQGRAAPMRGRPEPEFHAILPGETNASLADRLCR